MWQWHRVNQRKTKNGTLVCKREGRKEMRAKEFIVESMASISKSIDGGSLEGYVVDTSAPAIANYLQSQGASKDVIDHITTTYNRVGLIRNMWVDPDQRGQGIGSDLVSDAIEEAALEGAEAIVLVADLGEENKVDLVNWYKSFDFEVVGTASGDPVMIKDLR
jgi:ribosomal protein S18 acetylase RimI-like enzyme